MKHTPGPWKAVIANYSEDNLSWLACADVVTPKGATLVRFEGTQDYQKNEEHEANARLIAAAPELLEQLERCLANIETLNALIADRCPDLQSGSSDTETMTRKVIAKAKGGAQ